MFAPQSGLCVRALRYRPAISGQVADVTFVFAAKLPDKPLCDLPSNRTKLARQVEGSGA